MEIEPGIHQLTFGRQGSSGIPSPNAFLVCGEDSSAFLDTGWPQEADHRERMAYLRESGAPPLAWIVMLHRHPDHAGGALRLHQDTGAPLACHPLDRPSIDERFLKGEATVDRMLNGGERIDLGGLTLELIHAPGHTLGCLAVFIPQRRALFTTDTVLSTSTTAVGDQGDLGLYVESLQKLRKIDAARIYPGHGPVVDDPAGRLDYLIEHRKRRERELLDMLEGGPQSVADMFGRVYADISPRLKAQAEAQIRSGLRKLVSEGKVEEASDGLFVAAAS